MFSADLGGYTPPPVDATNPTFDKVALLLHGDGTNGSQNNTFLDSSTNNFTITRTGNVAQGTFSPFSLPEGQWSNAFGSSGGTTNYLGWSQIDLTSDFTVECWLYQTKNSSSGYVLFMQGTDVNTEFTLNHTTVGSVGLYKNGWIVNPSGTSVTFNAWHHVAWVREGTTCRIYVDGIQQGTGTSNVSIPVNYIGSYTGGGYEMNGYVSNVRIVNGTCLYPNGTTFTPSTTPLTAVTNTALLTCQSNRFKDNSSNNFTITRNGDTKVTAFSPFAPSAAYSASTNGGSAYFDGSGDYLSVPSDASLSFNTGDFTVEAWVYFRGSKPTVAKGILGGQSSGSFNFYFDGGTYTANRLVVSNRLSNQISYSWIPDTETWYHLAVSRSGTSMQLFINGISVTTVTASTSYGSAIYSVGGDAGGGSGWSWNGYISNLRIVKGTAVYTSNFTPPTAPLTAVANTQLLLNCTNAGIIDNAGKNDIETVGNAQISTSVKKYGTGSMYFDGAGDWLALSATPSNSRGTGDFTIEAWIYPTDSSTTKAIIGNGLTAGSFRIVVLATTNTVRFVKSPNTAAIDSSTPCSLNTWQHIAVVRSGTTATMYLNGVSVGSATDSSDYTVDTLIIGAYNASGSQPWYGYIDDLRITKGQALYTSNFTPPTQAFPNF